MTNRQTSSEISPYEIKNSHRQTILKKDLQLAKQSTSPAGKKTVARSSFNKLQSILQDLEDEKNEEDLDSPRNQEGKQRRNMTIVSKKVKKEQNTDSNPSQKI